LLRVHRGLIDLKDLSSLRAFAMKAALFELQDFYRGRYSAKESLLDPDHTYLQQGNTLPSSTHLDLERALAVLSPTARRIIELREYGYRYEEIARVVGSTEAAIKMQVKRAFEKMRDVLLSLFIGFLFWQT
jgi:RNA polymerase sigma-70 factor (ECF subfamily)